MKPTSTDMFARLCVWKNIFTELELKLYHNLCGRDGNLPVSFVQKYLMRKLDLSSESEVKRLISSNLVEILVSFL